MIFKRSLRPIFQHLIRKEAVAVSNPGVVKVLVENIKQSGSILPMAKEKSFTIDSKITTTSVQKMCSNATEDWPPIY